MKLASLPSDTWSYPQLAASLGLSLSEAHGAVQRSIQSGLMDARERLPRRSALAEFLIHGAKYAFPAQRGEMTRGIPTSYAAPPLKDRLTPSQGAPPVWPDPHGHTVGYAITPLYRTAPQAAAQDERLYEYLAMFDAIRDGQARERRLAEEIILQRLTSPSAHPRGESL